MKTPTTLKQARDVLALTGYTLESTPSAEHFRLVSTSTGKDMGTHPRSQIIMFAQHKARQFNERALNTNTKLRHMTLGQIRGFSRLRPSSTTPHGHARV